VTTPVQIEALRRIHQTGWTEGVPLDALLMLSAKAWIRYEGDRGARGPWTLTLAGHEALADGATFEGPSP
jgi:hypothetical protein